MAGLDLATVRDAVGPKLAVIIEETGGVLGEWMRDLVNGQALEITREFVGHPDSEARDDIAAGRGPP